jgi:hypothetical protein
LRDDFEEAIAHRMVIARQAVEAARAADPLTGLTLAETTAWAARRAEGHCAEAEGFAAEVSDLLSSGKMNDAVRALDGSAEAAAQAAARDALAASDAAVAIRDRASEAEAAVHQARDLVALAARSHQGRDVEWLVRAAARVTTLAEAARRVRWGAQAAGEIALGANATSIQASVALEVARTNLEVAGLRAGALAAAGA